MWMFGTPQPMALCDARGRLARRTAMFKVMTLYWLRFSAWRQRSRVDHSWTVDLAPLLITVHYAGSQKILTTGHEAQLCCLQWEMDVWWCWQLGICAVLVMTVACVIRLGYMEKIKLGDIIAQVVYTLTSGITPLIIAVTKQEAKGRTSHIHARTCKTLPDSFRASNSFWLIGSWVKPQKTFGLQESRSLVICIHCCIFSAHIFIYKKINEHAKGQSNCW